MEKVIKEILEIVELNSRTIRAIPETELVRKPHPNKWSKIEVLGHLIDSAQNNVRRFICGQYETAPPKITYDQDFWVAANNYGHRPSDDVIATWKLINEQLCAILKSMPPVNYSRQCDTGNQTPQLRALEFLAVDYVKHMKHHLNQILPGSYDVVYP